MHFWLGLATMLLALLRHSSYLVLALAFVCSLLLGAEFDLIGLATGSYARNQKLELGELLTLSGLFSLLLAGMAVVNGRFARHERRKRTEIERTANIDALTGIANRRLFFDRLEVAFARSQEGAACAVILLDLDGFKAVNDLHGHAAGDCILKHVARQIDRFKGRDTLAARLGGDEFALVIEGNAASELAVHGLIANLKAAIAEPVSHAGAIFAVRASIGVAFNSQAVGSPAALLDAADGAMYRVKRRNRNRIAA
jgi:diguanylate cyclase (GGDEF)-like protein